MQFVTANASVALRPLFTHWPGWPPVAPLASVSVLYPDPWFKARHHKRRVLTPAAAVSLADLARPGAPLLIKSDVKDVITAAADLLRASGRWTWVADVTEFPPCRNGPPAHEITAASVGQLEWTREESALASIPSEREHVAPRAWRCLFRATSHAAAAG